jgi:hypothetical protein
VKADGSSSDLYGASPLGQLIYDSNGQGASAPDWIGTSQERFFELSGDRLTLTAPVQQIAGVESKTVLVWQREK